MSGAMEGGVGADVTPQSLSKLAAELYAGAASGFSHFIATHRPRICPFHLLLQHVPAGATILDVGCGNGLLLGLLAHSGRISRGVGFDSNAAAIATASAMAGNLRKTVPATNLQFTHRSVGETWPDGAFDVVSVVDVLHHVPPAAQESVIRMAASKVAPGGRMIYKDMARRPRWRASMNRLHDLLMARQWIHYLPVEDVERWAQDEGLKPLAGCDMNMLVYRHEMRVFERGAGTRGASPRG